MSLRKTNNKGFTLIELVIVLAIAALIIAAVLVAVRGAQQSRRDSARRDSAAQIGALMEEYAGNHNGNPPAVIAEMPVAQIQARTDTPDGGNYTASAAFGTFGTCPAGTAASPNLAQDTYQVSFNGRRWQVAMGLEGGNATFCTNS